MARECLNPQAWICVIFFSALGPHLLFFPLRFDLDVKSVPAL